MKKKWNKVTAALLMLVMVVTTVLGAAPALSVKAEPVTMGHLKSGSGNANGHFGSATQAPGCSDCSTKAILNS